MEQNSFKRFIASLLWGVTVFAQTKVSLRDQAREIDFSGAVSARPLKTGTVLPATCSVGEMYFRTNAAPGSNIQICVATNTWMVASGNSVPSAVGQDGRVLTTVSGAAAWADLSGDVTGAASNLRVQRLQNRPVANTAPATGQALVWNSTLQQWEPQTISGGGGGGSMSIQSDGSLVGTRSTLNVASGFGMLNVLSDNGGAVVWQPQVDTAVIQSKAAAQSGAEQICFSSSASVVSYTCSMAPVLTAYTTGMVVNWRPDVTGTGGNVTLNIDTLGARPVKLADGVTNPAAGDLAATRMFPLWYDGTNFRLMSSPVGSGGGGGGSTTFKDTRYFTAAITEPSGFVASNSMMQPSQNYTASVGSGQQLTPLIVLGDTSLKAIQFLLDVPPGLSNLDVTVDTVHDWGASGAFTLNISTACIASGENVTTATYNTAAAASGTFAAANTLIKVTATAVPITGCTDGELLRLNIVRNAADASTNDVGIIGARLVMTRSLN